MIANGALEQITARLAALDGAGLRRRLEPPRGLDLASNDYLGFAADPELRRRIVARLAALDDAGESLGVAASRQLRGTSEAHLRLERRLADWTGAEAALLFPSGWQANVGLLAGLLRAGDLALSDADNHASVIDGLRLSGCAKAIYPHGDAAAVAARLAASAGADVTAIVTESVFSMDGTVAPLAELGTLAARHGALLVVDEAHATGLWGARGTGVAEAAGLDLSCLVRTHTFGKSLGLAGACISGPRDVVELLISASRAFLFTTAIPPLAVAAIDAALDHLAAHPERAARVHELAALLRAELRRHGVDPGTGEGPIVPVRVGANEAALRVAGELAAAGYDARAVRPPTVPPGTARLRLSVHADHRPEQLTALAAAVARALGTATTVAAATASTR